MQCEQCNKHIESVEEAHSMLVVLQKVDASGYSFFQCDNGGIVDGHSWQHWHCCKDEMLKGVEKCITAHYKEEALQHIPLSQVSLHAKVLNTGLSCPVCQKDITDIAYRFCLTVATPINYVFDESSDMTKEWCCSLEHAKVSAIDKLK